MPAFYVSANADAIAAQNINPKEFSSRILGDWIGVCDQVVGEKKAPAKCFTLKVSQTGQNTYNSKIVYYQKDTGSNQLVTAGETNIVTTVYQDESAKSVITGKGLAFLDDCFKKETHSITETFKATGPNQLEGTGSGTMSVSGTTMNMGKSGKITKSKTKWSISGDILTIEANINVKFSFLCFGQINMVKTTHKAWRGTDIAIAFKKINMPIN